MNILEALSEAIDTNRAVDEMTGKMEKSLGLEPGGLDEALAEATKDGKPFHGSELETRMKAIPEYNGKDDDTCACPACNARRAEGMFLPGRDATLPVPGNDVAGAPLPPGASIPIDALESVGKEDGVVELMPGVKAINLGKVGGAGLEAALNQLFGPGSAPEDLPPVGLEKAMLNMREYAKGRGGKTKEVPFDYEGSAKELNMAADEALKMIEEAKTLVVRVRKLATDTMNLGPRPEREVSKVWNDELRDIEATFRALIGH